jgi:hypothetical protein
VDSQRLPRLPSEQGHKEPHDKDDDHVDPAATSAAISGQFSNVRTIATRRFEDDEKGRERAGREGEAKLTRRRPVP